MKFPIPSPVPQPVAAPAPTAEKPRPRPCPPRISRIANELAALPETQRRLTLPEPATMPEPIAADEDDTTLANFDVNVRVVELLLSDGKTKVEALECIDTLKQDNPALYREQIIQGVEMLYLQGVTRTSEIRHVYNISERLAMEAKEELQLRFSASGGLVTPRAARGEMLKKYEFLEMKLWNDYKNAQYFKDKNGIVANLITVWDKKAALSGLNADSIAKVLEVKSDSDVVSRMGKQTQLLGVFSRLCDTLEDIQANAERTDALEMEIV